MKQSYRSWVAIVSAGLTLSALAHAALSRRSVGGAQVTFQRHRSGGPHQVVGETSDFQVGEQDGRVLLTVSLADLRTGIDLRDRGLWDKYLRGQQVSKRRALDSAERAEAAGLGASYLRASPAWAKQAGDGSVRGIRRTARRCSSTGHSTSTSRTISGSTPRTPGFTSTPMSRSMLISACRRRPETGAPTPVSAL